MDEKEMIKRVVDEVLTRLQQKLKKATVLFTGGAYGAEDALPQVKQLLADGWDLTILLTSSAEYVLTPERIKKEMGITSVYLEREVKGLKPFYDGISTLIIPTLTLNSAVKIALGIADNLTGNLVSHAIMKGIPVVAAKDGCDINSPIRKELGLNKAPMAYRERMSDYLDILESYGIKLVEAKQLHAAVEANVPVFNMQRKAAPSGSIIQYVKKRVLTRTDIIEAKRKAVVLHVAASTIISPLALETADEQDVKIIRD